MEKIETENRLITNKKLKNILIEDFNNYYNWIDKEINCHNYNDYINIKNKYKGRLEEILNIIYKLNVVNIPEYDEMFKKFNSLI